MRTLAQEIAVILISVVCMSVHASDEPVSPHEVMVLLDYEKQVRESQKACIDMAQALDMEFKYETDPGVFGGIIPGAPKWGRAAELYREYLTAVCQEPPVETQLKIVEEEFKDGLTDKELAQVREFLRSEAGLKFVEVSVKSSRKIGEQINVGFSPALREAIKKYQDGLRKLKQE